MWGVESQIDSIIQLRMSALLALNDAGLIDPFNSPIYLSLEFHAPEEMIGQKKDLDNLISGVCDALQSKPNNPDIIIHERFNNPDLSDIHPEKSILFYNDNQVWGINAVKQITEKEPFYKITVKTEHKTEETNLSSTEIQYWAKVYDQEHSWWNSEEDKIGKQIRRDNEFGLATLKEIIHWKFLTLKGREKRVNNLIAVHNDSEIRTITKKALKQIKDNDRINILREIKGVGVAIASTILTFYNPKEYCIYDIHVMRGVYGETPKYMFTSNKHYLKLLQDLRMISTSSKLPVRTIEKAYFKREFSGN
jgi:thermostable 8-oxoguanine DNA glycosylase